MQSVRFFAAGQPVAQGSKRHVGNGVMLETNPHLRSWRSVVAGACPMEAPLGCAVAVRLEFRFCRPKGHYGRRGGQPYLKEGAPLFKDSTPDLDKLSRGVLDALTGVAVVDDRLVAVLEARKVWTEGQAGVAVTIEAL